MEKNCEFPLKSEEKSRDIRKNGIKGWKIVFFFPIFRFRTKNAAPRLPQGRKWGSLPILRLGKSFCKNRKSGNIFVKKSMILCSIFCENTIFQMYFCISPLHSPYGFYGLPAAMRFCTQNRREGHCPSPTMGCKRFEFPCHCEEGEARRGNLLVQCFTPPAPIGAPPS